MSSDDSSKKIDKFARDLIRRKAKQLIRRPEFSHQDREDLEQDLYARLVQSLPRFDPNQAHLNVFTTTVVERYVANILRNRQAAKRDHRRTCSLSVIIQIPGEGPTELAQTIGHGEFDARRGSFPRSDEELAQLASDLELVIANLPETLRELAERCKTQTVSEIARETGVPRTTLTSRVRTIRKRFEQAGLKDYL